MSTSKNVKLTVYILRKKLLKAMAVLLSEKKIRSVCNLGLEITLTISIINYP